MMSIVGGKGVHKIIDKKHMKWVRKLRMIKEYRNLWILFVIAHFFLVNVVLLLHSILKICQLH